MIRISNTHSSAPSLALFYAGAATTATLVLISVIAYFAKVDLLRNTDWKILKSGGILCLYFTVFFLHLKKSIPQRISIDNNGIVTRFSHGDEIISFDQLTNIRTVETDDSRFLVIETAKRKIKIEVSECDITRINEYIPTY